MYTLYSDAGRRSARREVGDSYNNNYRRSILYNNIPLRRHIYTYRNTVNQIKI